jgi:3-deoxy-D-manno-octulosonic-acid transferase
MPTPLDIAYLTALGLAAPWVARRLMVSKKGRQNFSAKLSGRVSIPAKSRPRVWFHAVSVGEVHLLRNLIARFQVNAPGIEIVVSSSTDTGQVEAQRLFADHSVIPAPLDFSWSLREAIQRVQPDLLVLAESELWPGLLINANHAGIPVIVINARLSPKSARRWLCMKPLARAVFGRVSHFAVQTEDYANNLRTLGVAQERITITGSMKYDGVESNRNNTATQELRRLFGLTDHDLIWVAGSTQEPEEARILEIYRRLRPQVPELRLIIVPRQKDRFQEVAELVSASGCRMARRSQISADAARDAVIVVDTIGELRAVWGLADIAFVGGSLDGRRGGQNMIEPAAYGAAVTFGPHVWNFRSTVEQLLACRGAIQVGDFAELERTIQLLLKAVTRRELGAAAQQFVLSQQGATDRTISVINRYLQKHRGAA